VAHVENSDFKSSYYSTGSSKTTVHVPRYLEVVP